MGALLDAKALHGGRRARDHLLCLAQVTHPRYTVKPDSSFRRPAQEGLRVGAFLVLAACGDGAAPGPVAAPAPR